MSATQFEAIQQQLTSSRKAVRERNTLLDHLARLDDELDIWQGELAYLEKKVALEQKDVDEVSGKGLAAAMLWLTGKQGAIIAKEEQELARAIEAYEACQQKVQQMQVQQEAWEYDLVGLADYDEEIAQLEQDQLDMILALPQSETLQHLLAQIEDTQKAQRAIAHLPERCEHVFKMLEELLNQDFLIWVRAYDNHMQLIEGLVLLERALAEAERPFWSDTLHAFSHLDAMRNIYEAVGNFRPFRRYMKQLKQLVTEHHNSLIGELTDLQHQLQQQTLEKESLISQLWKRENFI